jgi:RND family efflux transporter MFP subunit
MRSGSQPNYRVIQRAIVRRWVSIGSVAIAVWACAAHEAESGQPRHGALPTQVERLALKTVPQFDDYLASVTSRRSVTLFPQVSGYVGAIHVRSGAKVRRGTPLIDIEPGPQLATLRSLEADLQNKRATLAYAAEQDKRSRALLQAGVLSRLDYDQRHNQHLTAEADVKAAQAQVQAQSDLLRFYHIAAPTAGVVGDVPVKVGDYVTPQTRVTSVNQARLVEAYVYIPVSKANTIESDATIELMNERQQVLCKEHPSFVSPDVNIETQTVLLKAVCPNEGVLRAAEVLRAHVVWEEVSAVTIPITAVTRLSGQYFAFVVTQGPKGAIVHQRPISVGDMTGNDFVVTRGLKTGMEVAVSNIQKLRDGMPIIPLPAGEPESPSEPG